VHLFVPLGWNRHKFAVGVAPADVGSHDRRQRAGVMQLVAAAFDPAFVGEVAQHLPERCALGVLQAEGARDLARADLAALGADKGEKLFRAGQGRAGFGLLSGQEAIDEKGSRRQRSDGRNIGIAPPGCHPFDGSRLEPSDSRGRRRGRLRLADFAGALSGLLAHHLRREAAGACKSGRTSRM